ncbi:16224_t:CDS:2, partial [Acaulospora colombiana]
MTSSINRNGKKSYPSILSRDKSHNTDIEDYESQNTGLKDNVKTNSPWIEVHKIAVQLLNSNKDQTFEIYGTHEAYDLNAEEKSYYGLSDIEEVALKAIDDISDELREISLETIADVKVNNPIAKRYEKYLTTKFNLEFPSKEEQLLIPSGSTDQGNVTYTVPGFHPFYNIHPPPGESNHTPGFTKQARTELAHTETLKATKGITLV